MICPKCNTELEEEQKFCNKCGYDINNKLKQQKILFILIGIFIFAICVITILTHTDSPNINQNGNGNYNLPANEDNYTDYEEEEQIRQEKIQKAKSRVISYKKYLQEPDKTLKLIDIYQRKYFSVIKRNDMLLAQTNYDGFERDLNDLSALYEDVKRRIGYDNYYLSKYNDIQRQYENNPGENTYEINLFASQKCKAVDDLLNETYKAVKNTVSDEVFQNLIISEQNWLKELEAYQEVFESQGYGTVGGLAYSKYNTDMKQFRTLLLMLYLK